MTQETSNSTGFSTPYNPALHNRYFRPHAVFFSASVVQAGREKETDRSPRDSDIVRGAIVACAREVLSRGWNVVFGGHPQISPLLFVLAREFDNPSDGRVICFQSDQFADRIPATTQALGEYGHVFRTPEIKGGRPRETVDLSLVRMREDMLSVPYLRAGVFIGGMAGVLREARMLRKKRIAKLLLFAFPGTGSAAEQLFDEDPATYSGDSIELASLMAKKMGQAIVAKRVVGHLEAHLNLKP
jgi:hypothetical protein